MPDNENTKQNPWGFYRPEWRGIQVPFKTELQEQPIEYFYRQEGVRGLKGLSGLPEEERDEWKRRMQANNPNVDWDKATDEDWDNLFQNRRAIRQYGEDVAKQVGLDVLKEDFNRQSAYLEAAEKYKDEPLDIYSRILDAARDADADDTINFIDKFKSIDELRQQQEDIKEAMNLKPSFGNPNILTAEFDAKTSFFYERPSNALARIIKEERTGEPSKEGTTRYIANQLDLRTKDLVNFEKNTNDKLLAENQSTVEEIRDYVTNLQQTDPKKFNELFNDIFLGDTNTRNTVYGEIPENHPGINYYKEFKNHGALKHFDTDEKALALTKYLSLQTISQDENKAKEALEVYMQDYIADNQGWARNFWRRTYGLVPGTASYIASMIEAPVAVGLGVSDLITGADRLGEWVTPTDERILKQNVLNPSYWQYVEQFNTFSPNKIVESIHNGGISKYAPQYHSTGDTGWRMLGEMYAMTKFLIPGIIFGRVAPAVGMSGNWQFITQTLASAGGIGVSYASQSAQTVAQQTRDAIASKINTDAYNYASAALDTDEIQELIRTNAEARLKKDWEEEQNRRNAGKENTPKVDLTEAQIEKYIQPYISREREDFINATINKYKTDNPADTEENESLVERATRTAFATTAIVETLRMAILIPQLKKFMLSPAARDVASTRRGLFKLFQPEIEKPLLEETAEGVKRLYTKNDLAKKQMEQVIGGFESNWVDEATHTLGESLGLSQFNNELLRREDPEGYAEMYHNNFAPILMGVLKGFEDGIDKLSTAEAIEAGLIGAGGVVIGGVPKVGNIVRGLSGRQLTTPYDRRVVWHKGEDGRMHLEERTVDEEGKESFNPISIWQKADLFWNNGLLSQAADDAWRKEYDPTVEAINKVLSMPRYLEMLKNIAYTTESFRSDELIDDADISAKEDNKLRSMLQFIQVLEDVTKDGTLLDDVPQVQRARETIERIERGEVTEEDITNFLADNRNKDIAEIQDEAERKAKAREVIQENLKQFNTFRERYNYALAQLENGATDFSRYTPETVSKLKHQIASIYALDDALQKRNEELNKEISGNTAINTTENLKAKYGNKAIYDLKKQSAQEEIKKIKEEIAKIDSERKEVEKKASKNFKANIRERREGRLRELDYEKSILKKQLNQWQYDLRKISQEASLFDENGELIDNTPLAEEEILSLSPVQRAEMLLHPERFSEAQQQIIKDLKAKRLAEDALFMDKVERSSREWIKYDHNKEAFDRLRSNVPVAADYLNRLESRRTQGIIRANEFIRTQQIYEILDKIDPTLKDGKGNNLLTETLKMVMSRELSPNPDRIDDYIKHRPEIKGLLEPLKDTMKMHQRLARSTDAIIKNLEENRRVKNTLHNILVDTNTVEEVNAALDDAITKSYETGDTAFTDNLRNVIAYARSLDKYEKSTTADTREGKRNRRKEKKLEEEQKRKDNGANYHWNGYIVGFNVFNNDTGKVGTVTQFGFRDKKGNFSETGEKNQTGVMKVKWSDGSVTEHDLGVNETQTTIEHLGIDRQLKNLQQKAAKKAGKKVVNVSKPVDESMPVEDVKESEQQPDDEGYWRTTDGVIVTNNLNTADIQTEKELAVTYTSEEELIRQARAAVDPNSTKLIGNRFYEWDTEALLTSNDRVMERDTKAGKEKQSYWKFCDDKGWRIQDIIDKELWKFLVKKPNTELHYVNINPNLHPELNNVKLLAIEFTPDVKKIHNNELGGVFESNGKQWLTVGVYGYANGTNPEAYNNKVKQSNDAKWFDAEKSKNSEFFVEDAFTRVKQIKTPQLTKRLVGDSEVENRSIIDLLNDKRRRNGMTLKNAAWMIKTRSGMKTVNVGNNRIMVIREDFDRSGNTFILAPASNGYLIPIYIQPTTFDQLKEGALLDRIETLLRKAISPDLATRTEAMQKLNQYLYMTKKNGIGWTKDNKSVWVNGNTGMTLRPTPFENLSVSTFIDAIKDAGIKINITETTLGDEVLLNEYADAGALNTDIAYLGTVNASYDVYEIGLDGKPIIPKTPEQSAEEVEQSINVKKVRSQEWVGGKLYTLTSEGIFDSNGTKISPSTQTYTNVFYQNKIRTAKISAYREDAAGEIFIIDESTERPIVVVKDKKTGNFRVVKKNSALDIIKEKQSNILQKQREAKLKEYSKILNKGQVHLMFPNNTWEWSNAKYKEVSETNPATARFYDTVDRNFSDEQKEQLASVSDTQFMDAAIDMVRKTDQDMFETLSELKRSSAETSIRKAGEVSSPEAKPVKKTEIKPTNPATPASTLSPENLMSVISEPLVKAFADFDTEINVTTINTDGTTSMETRDFDEAVRDVLKTVYNIDTVGKSSQEVIRIIDNTIHKPMSDTQTLQEWFDDFHHCNKV